MVKTLVNAYVSFVDNFISDGHEFLGQIIINFLPDAHIEQVYEVVLIIFLPEWQNYFIVMWGFKMNGKRRNQIS